MTRLTTELKQLVQMPRVMRAAVWCLLLGSVAPMRVEAQTLLEISGPEDTGEIVDADEAVAASFTLTQAFSNVSITAPTTCTGCSGGVFLMKNAIGPTAIIADLVAAEAFNPGSPIIQLSGLNLAPGDYFVILAMEEGFSGAAGWSGSVNPTITEVNGITAGFDFNMKGSNPRLSGGQISSAAMSGHGSIV